MNVVTWASLVLSVISLGIGLAALARVVRIQGLIEDAAAEPLDGPTVGTMGAGGSGRR